MRPRIMIQSRTGGGLCGGLTAEAATVALRRGRVTSAIRRGSKLYCGW